MSTASPTREDLLRPVSLRERLRKSPDEVDAELVELRRLWWEGIEELTFWVAETLAAEECPVCRQKVEGHKVCLVSVVGVRSWLPLRMLRLALAVKGERWERCVALGQGRLDLRYHQVWIWAIACGKESGLVLVFSPSRGEPPFEVLASKVVAFRPALEESLKRAGLAWDRLGSHWFVQLCSRR